MNKSFEIVLKQLWNKGNMPIQRGYIENNYCQYRHSGSLFGRQDLCGVNNVTFGTQGLWILRGKLNLRLTVSL